LQWFREQEAFTPELVQTALQFAQRISNIELRASLHDALAYAYMRILDMKTAFEHAQMAYIHQLHVGASSAVGQALFTLAAVYRNTAWYTGAVHLGKRAPQLLAQAREYMTHVKRETLNTLLAYEEGLQYFQMQAYPLAVEWLQSALDEAIDSGRQHYIASSRHALGLAQTETKQYVEARRNLIAAAGVWNMMQNQFERANALHALGYLEILDKRRDLGLDYLNIAMTICEQLPHDAQVEYLRERIQQTIDEA
jgi:tetratricopeptide (TPR) repeat protein